MSAPQRNAAIFVDATGIVIVQPQRGVVASPLSVHGSAARNWPMVAPISPWEIEVAGFAAAYRAAARGACRPCRGGAADYLIGYQRDISAGSGMRPCGVSLSTTPGRTRDSSDSSWSCGKPVRRERLFTASGPSA